MKIYILSSNPEIPSTSLLSKALRQLKHRVEVYDPLTLSLSITPSQVFLKNKALPKPDLVIPRLGWHTFAHGIRIVQTFEAMGCTCLNSSTAIQSAHDKLTTLTIWGRHHLPIPLSHYFDPTQDSYEKFDFKFPIVIKTLSGSQGKGVSLAANSFSFRAWVELLRTEKVKFIIQEFIKGTEVRVLVFRGQILTAMQRLPKKGEFRSNLHLGGQGKNITLQADEEALVLQATKALNLEFAGVDFIKNKQGITFLEINPFPGLAGISKVTKTNQALVLAKLI